MSDSRTDEPKIYEVWRDDLEEAFENIMDILDTHTVIGMDTEFPGEIYTPQFSPSGNRQYDKVKLNVDQLSLIQLGLTFATPSDSPKKSTFTYQFNFHFDTEKQAYQKDSITLLRKAGINLERHKTDGIDAHIFGEYLTTSGIVCNERMTWTTFHASYDFGYLLKVLTNQRLPKTESEFVAEMKLFFPVVYDLKVMTQTKGGLSKLADDHGVQRHGIMHQAGSDSLLTVETYQTYVDTVLNGKVDEQYLNKIAGLKSDWPFNPSADFIPPSQYQVGRGHNFEPYTNTKISISANAYIPPSIPDPTTVSQSPLSHSPSVSMVPGLSASGVGLGGQSYPPIPNSYQTTPPVPPSQAVPPSAVPTASASMLPHSTAPDMYFTNRLTAGNVHQPASPTSGPLTFGRDFSMGMAHFPQMQMTFNSYTNPINQLPPMPAPMGPQATMISPDGELPPAGGFAAPMLGPPGAAPAPPQMGMIGVPPHGGSIVSTYPGPVGSSQQPVKRQT